MKKQAEENMTTFFKVIWAWEDEKEENWLEQQALQGWNLVEVAPFFYKFKREKPRKVVYRLDYKGTLDKDYQEYLSIFRDSGWELVTRMSNWHYYRLEPDNNTIPDLYNTNRTKAQKYRRLLVSLIPIFFILVFTFNTIRLPREIHDGGIVDWIYFVGFILRLLISVFLVYGFIRIAIKIRKLESSSLE